MDNEEINKQETNSNIEQRYNDFLKKEIQEYCNADGRYEMYWDYRDEQEYAEGLPKLLADFDGDDIVSYLYEQMEENFIDGGYFPEDDFTNAIWEDIKKEDEELQEYFSNKWDNDEVMDDLYNNGYDGVDYGLEDVLKSIRIPVNIIIAPYNEQNYDMGSIISAFGSDYLPATNGKDLEADYLDNGITYLVHQQGHSLKELFDDIYGKKSDNKFIRSVVAEIHNNPAEAMSGLTVLAKVSVTTYADLIKAMNNKSGYVEVSTDAPIGIFNPWIGTGSIFEIELEKPFVFSGNEIQAVQLDDVSGSGYYSVSDVYGGYSRNNDVTFTNEAPELYQEDLEEVMQYVADNYGNVNNDED